MYDQYWHERTNTVKTNPYILYLPVHKYYGTRQYILLRTISADVYARKPAISFQYIQLVLTCTQAPASLHTSKYDRTGKYDLVLSIPVGIVSTDTNALILFILILKSVQLILTLTP